MSEAYEPLLSDGEKAPPPVRPRHSYGVHLVWLSLLGASLLLHISDLKPLWFSEAADEIVDSCTPTSFNSGQWTRKANYSRSISTLQDFYRAVDMEGCAAEAHNFFASSLYDPGRYVEQASYEWTPAPSCHLRRLTTLEKLQRLVEQGGLLLVGDSLTYQHFYSLGCELYPHVIWSEVHQNPELDRLKGRESLQLLLLNPESPLLPSLRLPSGFDIDKRPVVGFQISAMPLGRDELRQLPNFDQSLIPDRYPDAGQEAGYSQSMNIAIDTFLNETAHYTTMVYSTGAHLSPAGTLPGATAGQQYEAALRASLPVFFQALAARMRPDQHVLVRAAPPGHQPGYEGPPLTEVPFTGDNYNWRSIPELNEILREETVLLDDDRFKWIDLERGTRMRPDAHIPGDGMHYLCSCFKLGSQRYKFDHYSSRSRLCPAMYGIACLDREEGDCLM